MVRFLGVPTLLVFWVKWHQYRNRGNSESARYSSGAAFNISNFEAVRQLPRYCLAENVTPRYLVSDFPPLS